MSERKLPTKEQWESIQAKLSGQYGYVKMLIDGFTVSFSRELVSTNRLAIMTYINGSSKGKWWMCGEDGVPEHEEARRFLQVSSKAIFPSKKQEELFKIFGKREAKKRFDLNGRHYFCYPWWGSFNALKRHLLKNNHDIEVISDGH